MEFSLYPLPPMQQVGGLGPRLSSLKLSYSIRHPTSNESCRRIQTWADGQLGDLSSPINVVAFPTATESRSDQREASGGHPRPRGQSVADPQSRDGLCSGMADFRLLPVDQSLAWIMSVRMAVKKLSDLVLTVSYIHVTITIGL